MLKKHNRRSDYAFYQTTTEIQPLSFAIKRSLSTTKRTWVPKPTRPSASFASTVKVSFRPSTAVNTAVAKTSPPIAVGLTCVVLISAPTVVEPSGRAAATAFIAAFSMSATIEGVAKTSKSPEPAATALFMSVTITFAVYVNPSFSINIVYFVAKVIKTEHLFVIDKKKMNKEFALRIVEKFESLLTHMGVPHDVVEKSDIIIIAITMIVTAFAITGIMYRITLFASRRIVKHKKILFMQQMLQAGRLRKTAMIIPPIVMDGMLPVMLAGMPTALYYTEKIVWIYFAYTVVIAINAVLSAIGESAFTASKYHDRPIKGLIQISKAVVYIIAIIVIISIITNKSPLYLIGGLGAFAAVLMLIAKDSIMGFVGGFLLLENDMVRLGDWIEIPGTSINGNVFDISLTIVKVRNWDNTIATIPPYTLINESFINWRGMSESGGRRIARGYTIKLDNIKPCSDNMLRRLKKIDKELELYITKKIEQLEKGETNNTANPDGLINGSIDTNAGLFRAYAEMYLRRHPLIQKDMIIMVRTLEPTEIGLPIQFYCFTTITEWRDYESIQSEIMEHFASIMPQFELYPFQSSGARETIISGLLEGQYPIERIDGLPYKTIK